MYNQRDRNIKILDRIDINDYIKQFIFHMEKVGIRRFNPRNLNEVKDMSELLNDNRNTTFKSVRDIQSGFYYWDRQEVSYVTSNLGRGKGYVFYFVCNGCGRRAKYLYEYNLVCSPLCRVCCKLKYTVATRKGNNISRIIRKPYLSKEDKQTLIKKAGITVQDVLDSNI